MTVISVIKATVIVKQKPIETKSTSQASAADNDQFIPMKRLCEVTGDSLISLLFVIRLRMKGSHQLKLGLLRVVKTLTHMVRHDDWCTAKGRRHSIQQIQGSNPA